MEILRLDKPFYCRPVLEVAPELLGKILCRKFPDGNIIRLKISEVEAYNGTSDRACHASKGRTPRTEVMFGEGGHVYVYFIYGIYWLLNIVTGGEGDASAVLIRGVEGISGPGKVGKLLHLDKSFYGENLLASERIWIEGPSADCQYYATPRIGIGYAGEPWVAKPWRYILSAER